jgi:hypothetical protein
LDLGMPQLEGMIDKVEKEMEDKMISISGSV